MEVASSAPPRNVAWENLGQGVSWSRNVVVGQNLRCLFGDGYHSTVVFVEGFLGVHRGTGVLTHVNPLRIQ